MILKDRIKKHEGLRLKVYLCPAGFKTIGYGHRLIGDELKIKSIDRDYAELLLDRDIETATVDLKEIFPTYKALPVSVRECLIELLFNLGRTRFLGFKKFIHAVNIRDWAEAARELRQSKWFMQVDGKDDEKGRGDELINVFEEQIK